jgi:predicted SprT family Zn-dependent metalloprotease
LLADREEHLHLDEARTLATGLMRHHGLTGWSFRFDRARRRFGCCRYGEKAITLSRSLVLLNSREQVSDTLLHEIAHALTPGDGHGARWKAKCREVGANPVRCYDDVMVRSPARGAAKYRLGCTRCEWWVDRRRITQSRYICRKCRAVLVYQERVSA